MLEIGNFSSILEVAFALNALLLIFSAGPLIEKKITEEMKRLQKDADKIRYPVSFVAGNLYLLTSSILKKISVILSLISITLLFVAGIWPEAALPWYILIPLLLLLVFTVPVGSYISYHVVRAPINTADREIDEVNELEMKRKLDEMNLGGNDPDNK